MFVCWRGELLTYVLETSLPKMSACFMESKDTSGCGDFRGEKTLSSLLECRDDVSSHLKRFHLSKGLLEYELILFRAGHFGLSEERIKNMFVCPKHRNSLGKYWNCTKSVCQHPEHRGKCEAVKGDRVFNANLARDVFEVFGITVTVGSREYYFLISLKQTL